MADPARLVAALALVEPQDDACRLLLRYAMRDLVDAIHEDASRGSDCDLFEQWLIERFSEQVRGEEYRATAEYHYLRAQWEREA